MLSSYVTSLIRTVVPILVGLVLSFPATTWVMQSLGVTEPQTGQAIAAALTFALSFLYYAIVRVAEGRWPQLGVLLGVPKAPVYGDDGAGTPTPSQDVVEDRAAGATAEPAPADAVAAPQSSIAQGVTLTIPVAASMPTVVVRVATESTSGATWPVTVLPAHIGVNGSTLRA